MDANSAIDIIDNEAKVSARTHHIEIRHFWICEKSRAALFIPQYVQSADNVADVMTKGLRPHDQHKMIAMLGMEERTDTR